MLRFEWNALRVGDRVQVHDDRAAHLNLLDGTVLMVETKPGKQAVNGIAIRLRSVDGDRVVWPSRLAVHTRAIAEGDDCTRCALTTSSTRLREEALLSAERASD